MHSLNRQPAVPLDQPPLTEIPPGDPIVALRVLVAHLEAKQRWGANSVWLNESARSVLRSLVKAQRTGVQPPAVKAKIKAEEAIQNRLPTDEPGAPTMAEMTLQMAEAEERAEKAPPARPTETPIASFPQLTFEEKTARLNSVKLLAEEGSAARALGTLRDVMVFAVGDPMAEIMFVGEAPGFEEEAQREPFVGPAGQLLTKIIGAMGLSREQVYISNICKFRPKTADAQGKENRKPTAAEMETCMPFIREEIEIIRPKAIVALGATAAEGMLGLHGVPVTRMRNSFHEYRGIPVAVTYHPSYLLRSQSNTEKRKVWEDLLKVMEKLGMPISEKQRGFFLNK